MSDFVQLIRKKVCFYFVSNMHAYYFFVCFRIFTVTQGNMQFYPIALKERWFIFSTDFLSVQCIFPQRTNLSYNAVYFIDRVNVYSSTGHCIFMRRPDRTTQVHRMPLPRFKYLQACAVFFKLPNIFISSIYILCDSPDC